MSSNARGSDSEVRISTEQECEMVYNGDPDLHASSLNDGNLIIVGGDDVGTFDQQPHIRTRNDTGLAVALTHSSSLLKVVALIRLVRCLSSWVQHL
jgi:hypothetical protein